MVHEIAGERSKKSHQTASETEAESIEWFIEGQDFSPSYDLAPRPTPPVPPPSAVIWPQESLVLYSVHWQPNSTCGFAAFEDILACWVHARGNVDGVAPDVVVELRGADDAAGDVAKVETDAEDEIEFDEGLVEVLYHALQAE